MSDKVDRVIIDKDEKWDTFFIPWLENHERNNIGAEDGVFVATVDPQLRFLQPDHEESFVKDCVANYLTNLSGQKLKRFRVNGLYHMGSGNVSEKQYKTFLEQSSRLQNYKDSTCCTDQLERENGLDLSLKHLHNVISGEVQQARSTDRIYSATSQVLLDEVALKMRKKHKKLSESTTGFLWDVDKEAPPKQCPDIECSFISDSAESAYDEDEEDEEEQFRASKPKRKEEETTYVRMYGFATSSRHRDLKVTSNLNLSRIYNILWLIPQYYGGLHSTYLYFGAQHTLFPVHVEDGLTWSLNYLHVGHPKIWVVIPPWATELLDFHLSKSGLYLSHCRCRNLLGHKVLFPTTDWLRERGIPYKIVVQRPGDLVVLYPNSAHFGFNMGSNIAQAVNIATQSWIPWGINAMKCTCYTKTVHLNIIPLVAAFREDLLPAVLKGLHVMTPYCLRSKRLLHDEIAKMHGVQHPKWSYENEDSSGESPSPFLKKVEHEGGCKGEVTIKCPAKKCTRLFSSSQSSKSIMIRHVKMDHKPISNSLLNRVEELFHQ